MYFKPQQRKDDRCVGHVQCTEDSRRAKQALHWIPDENRNSGRSWQDTICGDIDFMDTKMSVSRHGKERVEKYTF